MQQYILNKSENQDNFLICYHLATDYGCKYILNKRENQDYFVMFYHLHVAALGDHDGSRVAHLDATHSAAAGNSRRGGDAECGDVANSAGAGGEFPAHHAVVDALHMLLQLVLKMDEIITFLRILVRFIRKMLPCRT